MYQNWIANLAVVLATGIALVLSILTHYEGLIRLSRGLDWDGGSQRVKVLYTILALLLLHVLEIWAFGFALWVVLHWPECGGLSQPNLQFLDAVYFSAVTFTTVGYGDMIPVGAIRFLAGTEALVGLMLITWSASFTYLEMERFWRQPRKSAPTPTPRVRR
jgi:hypothetical protein